MHDRGMEGNVHMQAKIIIKPLKLFNSCLCTFTAVDKHSVISVIDSLEKVTIIILFIIVEK